MRTSASGREKEALVPPRLDIAAHWLWRDCVRFISAGLSAVAASFVAVALSVAQTFPMLSGRAMSAYICVLLPMSLALRRGVSGFVISLTATQRHEGYPEVRIGIDERSEK